MKIEIKCIKPNYEGRKALADKEFEDRFERDVPITAFGPCVVTYPKESWQRDESHP